MSKKLEQIFTELSTDNRKNKIKKNNKKIINKNLALLLIFIFSLIFYFGPLKNIYLEYLNDHSIIKVILSVYQLYFSINSFYKLLFLFVLYLIL